MHNNHCFYSSYDVLSNFQNLQNEGMQLTKINCVTSVNNAQNTFPLNFKSVSYKWYGASIRFRMRYTVNIQQKLTRLSNPLNFVETNLQAKALINVTNRHIRNIQEAVLTKSLTFATTAKLIHYLDIVIPTEGTSIKIPNAG